jgi:hypothetical protein
MQKARGQASTGRPAYRPPTACRRDGFRFSFTPLTGVLFAFPSRYSFTIGRRGMFSLGGWSPQLPTGFLVSRSTWDRSPTSSPRFRLRDSHPLWWPVPGPSTIAQVCNSPGCPRERPATPRPIARPWFRLQPFRSPLLRPSRLLSCPRGTEMFQFPRFASHHLSIQ